MASRMTRGLMAGGGAVATGAVTALWTGAVPVPPSTPVLAGLWSGMAVVVWILSADAPTDRLVRVIDALKGTGPERSARAVKPGQGDSAMPEDGHTGVVKLVQTSEAGADDHLVDNTPDT